MMMCFLFTVKSFQNLRLKKCVTWTFIYIYIYVCVCVCVGGGGGNPKTKSDGKLK